MSTASSVRPAGWYRLAVREVAYPTHDTVAVTLDLSGAPAPVFAYRAGQHLVVRHHTADGELRRSYSLCPPPDDPTALRLVIRPGSPTGFGRHARSRLAAGDVLEVSGPQGRFGLPETKGGHHVLVAGGCGITPLAPMAATALREDPHCRVSLVHTVRTSADALLGDELALLKDEFVDRFTLLHVLTRERRPSELLTGRIDGPRLRRLLALLGAEPGPDTHVALCGPHGLVETARATLTEWGAPPDSIRTELFSAAPAADVTAPAPSPEAPAAPHPEGVATVTTVLGGRTGVVTVRPQDGVVLDAVLRHHPDVPYACREGVCGSCRAKVVSGAVTTGPQTALHESELADGYTLACRARPRTAALTLDFDA